jgi:hypothetical protein
VIGNFSCEQFFALLFFKKSSKILLTTMEKLIASCGLDCAACDARIATLNNDDALRAKTADKWKVQFNAPDMTPEMINCTGCREEGVKVGHCAECEIRTCAIAKNFQTCAECGEMENCAKLKAMHQFVPSALDNLKELASF